MGNIEEVREIQAEYPAAVTYEDAGEEEYEGEKKRWEWRVAHEEKLQESEAAQEGMEAYYTAVMQELLLSENKTNTVCSPLNIYVALF